jgi:hypothetical protein
MRKTLPQHIKVYIPEGKIQKNSGNGQEKEETQGFEKFLSQRED